MGFGESVRKALDKLKGPVDKASIKEALKELQRALISANVDVSIVLALSARIEEKAFVSDTQNLTRREYIVKLFYDELLSILKSGSPPENPKKILLCGLFGSGKTTASGKLALYYKKRGKKVGVICADTFRPAAFEQLETNAKLSGAEFFGIKGSNNPGKVVELGLKKLSDCDLIICDTAGRSALDEELIDELKSVDKAFCAEEKWLVLSADLGALAKKQAQMFNEAIGVNGVIITKMDGSSKGGGALAACSQTPATIYFISTGEKQAEFEPFDADRYLSRVLGYGDLQALLEKVKDAELNVDDAEKLLTGAFTLKDFYNQLSAMKKIGPIGKIAEMMGLGIKLPKEVVEEGQAKFDSFKIIIDSMTEKERNFPDEINGSRVERIAKGSGKPANDVRELLRQYKRMKKMFRRFKDVGQASKMGEKDLKGMLGQLAQGKPKKKFRFK